MMKRQYIVPDCVGFYLLSLYPMVGDGMSQTDRDAHMGRIQWVVNKAIGQKLFRNRYVQQVEQFMEQHQSTTIEQLLSSKRS
jgi:hypothetical protein